MVLPELVTPRLRLRPLTLDDVDRLHALWTDPGVRRYLWDDLVISRDRALETVEASIHSAESVGAGMWTLWPRQEDVLVGFCGLRRAGPEPIIELLYGLAPQFWGRGLATEASQAVLAYAFQFHLTDVVYACTDAPNTASIRVMERLGMSRRPDREGLVCYSIRSGEEAPCGDRSGD